MNERSWNRRLVVVTASVVLAGGGLALPMTATAAAPVALQHGPVALDDDPDGVNETGTSNDSGFGVQLPVDQPPGDTEFQGNTRLGEDPDGVNEWGGGHWGSDHNRGSDSGARHMEDPDGVNEGGTSNDGGFGVQLPIDQPPGDTQVQTRIEAPF
ncbi:hypothetical protein [Streptomyces sp. NPDC058385]|uniref:hypothetical protein n=1 Tax=Streptomyces sp. NPDC058385 TaxID=3346473 RepID=UPI00364903DF